MTVASTARRDRRPDIAAALAGALMAALLALYNYQPYSLGHMGSTPAPRTWEEFLLVNLTGLVLGPALVIALLDGGRMGRWGWRPPVRGAAREALALFALMLPVLAVASRMAAFQAYYPIRPEAAYSWTFLAYHEGTYGLYMLGWEFFFRGYLTFACRRAFGAATAIIAPALVFGLMHWGKPMPEVAGSFLAGAALGWLALRWRSFIPCFLLHWSVSIVFDMLVIWARPGGLL